MCEALSTAYSTPKRPDTSKRAYTMATNEAGPKTDETPFTKFADECIALAKARVQANKKLTPTEAYRLAISAGLQRFVAAYNAELQRQALKIVEDAKKAQGGNDAT